MATHSRQVKPRAPINSAASDSSLIEVLHAPGPDEERELQLTLYSFLVGQWDLDITTVLEDGSRHWGQGEIHAGWILRGRGIQDVWMIPRLCDRKPGMDPLPGAGPGHRPGRPRSAGWVHALDVLRNPAGIVSLDGRVFQG